MNPATHLYKTRGPASPTASQAAGLYATTSAPARPTHKANPKEGGGKCPGPIRPGHPAL